MFSENFKKWDSILGWVVFFIALITYGICVEPTGSFWDAGEYISTSAKLQVGHPPGAPLFQMLGAFFAMFAFDSSQIAMMVNYMSVFSSAFTILFTFWTITNITKKMIGKEETFTNSKAIAVLGSGIVGALALTFSDSFWFNAVETEVYAMASFLMAVQLWMGLKWIDEIDSPRGNRWLVLISFLIGLTFGVQFMGFLAIPTIGLLYYFKRYKTTTVKNFLIANIAVVALLMFVYKFTLTYVLKIFGWAEVFFVNTIGLPFNSGTIIIGLLFVGLFIYGLKQTRKKNQIGYNTLILCSLFVFLGFSSWLMLPIRANAKVVINENNPEDAQSLLSYYNRDQYPSVDSPFYGAHYSNMFVGLDEKKPYRDGKPKYEKDHALGKYVIVNDYVDAEQNPNSDHVGFLPRMWSDSHAENYMKFQGPLNFKIKPEYVSSTELRSAVDEFRGGLAKGEIDESQYIAFLKQFSEYIDVQPPSIWQNLGFMFNYQLGDMCWRYFMWNFVGKQDDIQWHNDDHGNWLSGINILDNMRLGSQDNLPSDIKDNKGRNTYFFLPLILGIIGILFQIRKDPKRFWALLVFFCLTGMAIQIYTNPYPFQPRERDYSLVGSFYIFAIWIGIGVYGLFDEFKKMLSPKVLAPAVTAICLLAVPTLMAYQNWDDHDRSNKQTAQSMAKSYLDSVQEDADAILFTIGDNDTFTIWYAQEIEEYRTDVRTINTSLFATDWYIDQMKRKVYESNAIPSQLTHDKYVWGTRDVAYYQGLTKKRWDIKDFMNWIASDKPQTKIGHLIKSQNREIDHLPQNYLNQIFYPTNKIRVPVNKENVLKSGLVKEKDAHLIVDYIDITLPESGLAKNRIMMLDILANNDWKRPIYFTGGSFDNAEYMWMKDYLQLDGLVYKLVPIKTENKNRSAFEMGRIDSDLMYDIVSKWDWGNSGSANIYHDVETRRNSINYRGNLARLTEVLLQEEKMDKAKHIINIAMDNMPLEHYGYYAFVEPFLDGYYKVGEKDKARVLYYKMVKKYQERLDYYATLPLDEQYSNISDIVADMEAYRRNIDILIGNRESEMIEEETDTFNTYIEKFNHFYERENEPEERAPIGEPSIEYDSTQGELLNATKDTSLIDSTD